MNCLSRSPFQALHVITGHYSNAVLPDFTSNYSNYSPQALQKRPVITCNGADVTPRQDRGAPETPICELANIYREYISTSPVSLDDVLRIGEFDDPAAARCPACGSRAVMPTLLAPGEWECWEPSCFAVWAVQL